MVKLKEVLRMLLSRRSRCYDQNMDKHGPNARLKYNVYESGPTMQEYVKEQNRIHQYFKKKLIYPLSWLGQVCQRFLGKYIVKEVPTSEHFRNLWIFNKAFEDSMLDIDVLRSQVKGMDYDKAVKVAHKTRNNEPFATLRLFKEICLTIVKNDTFYLEFVNLFTFNLARYMNQEYHNDIYNGKVSHIVYTNNKIDDVVYFQARKLNGQVVLKNYNLYSTGKQKTFKEEIKVKHKNG